MFRILRILLTPTQLSFPGIEPSTVFCLKNGQWYGLIATKHVRIYNTGADKNLLSTLGVQYLKWKYSTTSTSTVSGSSRSTSVTSSISRFTSVSSSTTSPFIQINEWHKFDTISCVIKHHQHNINPHSHQKYRSVNSTKTLVKMQDGSDENL